MFGAVKNVNQNTGIRSYQVERLASVKKLFKARKSVENILSRKIGVKNWSPCKKF